MSNPQLIKVGFEDGTGGFFLKKIRKYTLK